jgi:phage-related protein (TIGR01555 family)
MTARKPKKRKVQVTREPKARPSLKISLAALTAAMNAAQPPPRPLVPYEPAPHVVPEGVKPTALAMDASPYDYVNGLGQFGCRNGFPGYPYLAELAQLPEYRKMVSTLAEEMTRKWIELSASGDEDKSEKIKRLDAAIRRYKLREHFRKAIEQDGYFGRGQLYADVKTPGGTLASDDDKELQQPLFVSEKKLAKGGLVGFRVVEPMWTYPGLYNSTAPLKKDFYAPSTWYVMGQTVHTSRLLMFISRPVPDLLKAAYSFGGLSLSQLAEPYIRHWLRTRDSVSDIVHSFSVSGLATDLEATLAGGDGTDLIKRAQLFNQTRDNRGLMLLNKESEEFFQFNIPLSGLDALQAQAQEQMSAVSSIPLVKLLGITPSGLNASSDGEIRVFYDYIHSQQEIHREPLKRAIDLIQLSEFGEIDPDIDFKFVPLYQLSEAEEAAARKSEADADAVWIGAGVISADEVRARLAADPSSPYNGLEVLDDDDDEDADPVKPGETAATA